ATLFVCWDRRSCLSTIQTTFAALRRLARITVGLPSQSTWRTPPTHRAVRCAAQWCLQSRVRRRASTVPSSLWPTSRSTRPRRRLSNKNHLPRSHERFPKKICSSYLRAFVVQVPNKTPATFIGRGRVFRSIRRSRLSLGELEPASRAALAILLALLHA